MRVVEEALEEMLLTSAIPVALIECDEVISKVGGQTMSFINMDPVACYQLREYLVSFCVSVMEMESSTQCA